MPNYDMACTKCDIIFPDMLLSYDEAKAIECPVCLTALTILPCRFVFKVSGSRIVERQKLEDRFRRRARRLEKDFTKTERDRFDNFCRNRGLRRYY